MTEAGSSITPEHWERAKKLEDKVAKTKGFSTYKGYARNRQNKQLSFEIDTHINANTITYGGSG